MTLKSSSIAAVQWGRGGGANTALQMINPKYSQDFLRTIFPPKQTNIFERAKFILKVPITFFFFWLGYPSTHIPIFNPQFGFAARKELGNIFSHCPLF